ncbi:hypothetical protein MML61_10240 [Mycobacterium marinum]|uniref:hypothetical protein n=1 Tax=Mycobacterium marinum TaxID=1781 RepID=UPI000E3ECA6B|nr:hypothetical protein [Mycobacterium marinum]RFZ05441.1 hypothetical protein VIMS_04943 [Mycobacterium marinum]WCS20151.1 hypothetical protein MML61_10240 [Mycobacterium marinum]
MPTTTPLPDLPLPPGAIADADGWEAWDNRFRVIFTPDETVPGTDIDVYGRAQQFPDGHVDDGTLDPEHPPQVAIDECWLSIDQARAAAAMILATADTLEQWSYSHLQPVAKILAHEFDRDSSPEVLAGIARMLGRQMQGNPALAGAVSRLLATVPFGTVVTGDDGVGR